MKRYSELIKLKDFKERYEYLRITQTVCDSTFGGSRWLNQKLYSSPEWKQFRQEIIIRDNACDLAMEGYEIKGKIIIHHLNPITKEQILNRSKEIFDTENVIVVSFDTHQAIHYGDEKMIPCEPIIRRPNDTIPWR